MIKELVNRISRHADKVLHFLACYGVVITFIAYGNHFSGVLTALLLSILKECYDQWSYGGFSMGDILADLVGIATALIIGGALMVK